MGAPSRLGSAMPLLLGAATAQPPLPPPNWTAAFDPLIYTSRNGGGGESSPFRWTDGRVYAMHSSGVSARDCPNAASIPAHRSFFHIRDMASGRVVACAAESAGHSFFSAAVDNARKRVWVFGSAQNRAGVELGPCKAHNYSTGCYVGAWWSTDLVHWTATAKALTVPDNTMVFNTDVTVLPAQRSPAPGLPPAQAVMMLEPRYNGSLQPANKSERYHFAVNVGTDGDLTRNWQLLQPPYLSAVSACPSLRYDAEEGWWYVVGGGLYIEVYRSKDLISWESSARGYMAVGAARLGRAYEDVIGPYYADYWSGLAPADVAADRAFLDNMTSWNWGVSDADVCCDDGNQAYLMHIISAQFSPKGFDGKWHGFMGGGTFNGTLVQFLRAHFS